MDGDLPTSPDLKRKRPATVNTLADKVLIKKEHDDGTSAGLLVSHVP
jgi:hypothetical protein